jgi:hypothetical protein
MHLTTALLSALLACAATAAASSQSASLADELEREIELEQHVGQDHFRCPLFPADTGAWAFAPDGRFCLGCACRHLLGKKTWAPCAQTNRPRLGAFASAGVSDDFAPARIRVCVCAARLSSRPGPIPPNLPTATAQRRTSTSQSSTSSTSARLHMTMKRPRLQCHLRAAPV